MWSVSRGLSRGCLLCCRNNPALMIHTDPVLGSIKNKETVLNVFDRQAKLMQRERAANMEDPSQFDFLKEEIGYRLADRVMDIKRKMDTCVDIGSQRGYVTRHLTGHSVRKLTALEMSPTWLEQCEMPEETEGLESCKKILLDEDGAKLPFEDSSVDLVTSSLSAHWVNDLPGLFSEVFRILKQDGVFLGSMFGGETLFELRCSLQLAELEREGGLGQHVSPFVEVQDLGNLLNRSGFKMITLDNDEIKVAYPDIIKLLRDLKGMGESNAAWSRKSPLRRDTLIAASAIYSELYGAEQDGKKVFPATFQIFYWIGWKPSSLTPKPLSPQKSDVSLKDLYQLDEILDKYGENAKKQKEKDKDNDKSDK